MIGIIDYEVGNLFSLQAALKRLGCKFQLVSEAEEAADCSALILPGVGAFGDAILNLKEKGLDRVVVDWVNSGKPLLGICLGMQLLFEKSEEHGDYQGLSILPGLIKKIPPGLKVPHMGWNELLINKDHQLFKKFTGGHVYFVHSYYALTAEEYILAKAPYGIEIPAIVGKDNIVGMQFHPEKSGKVGMELLNNWTKNLVK